MNIIQYDLFDEPGNEYDAIKRSVDEVKFSCEKTRKGMFVRHNELSRLYVELNHRLDIIEKNICRYK